MSLLSWMTFWEFIKSRIAIRESCTSICDVIFVVNDILRIHQDTVLLIDYSFHISVGAHSGITINFFNVRRIRLRELSSAFIGGMCACGNWRQYARASAQLQFILIQDTRAWASVTGCVNSGNILRVPLKHWSFHILSARRCPWCSTSSFLVIQDTL